MPLPDIFDSMGALFKEIQIREILQGNERSGKYGLILSAEEAQEIIEERSRLLRNYGRVELDLEVAGKLINHFCSSPFIQQTDYALTLTDLLELFYYLKNETDDEIGDDELIITLQESFNHACGGSLELLKGRELESLIRRFKFRNQFEDDFPEGEELY